MKEKNKVFIFGTPEHFNLGDHAICIMQKRFIQEVFKTYEVVEVTSYEFENVFEKLKSEITTKDIITIIGGGNMGNQYKKEENTRQTLIKTFKDNFIVSFPQSIFFCENDGNKEKDIENFKKVYSSHDKLFIFARDKKSEEMLKELLPDGKIYLCPDVVFAMEKEKEFERDGVLLATRSDLEGVLSSSEQNYILRKVKQRNLKINYYDTTNEWYKPEEREVFVKDFVEKFSTAELIVTDRLHGMIFATITKTPCVVFGNYNHKIKYAFEWIKDLGYIQYIENISEFEDAVNKVLSSQREYDLNKMKNNFTPLLEVLNTIKNNK